MSDTTKSKETFFNHTNHINLWNWLLEHPDKYEYDWQEWENNGGSIPIVANMRFDCDYAVSINKIKHLNDIKRYCRHCPFGDFENKNCLNGLYETWCEMVAAGCKKEASVLATLIRDYSIRKDVEVKIK